VSGGRYDFTNCNAENWELETAAAWQRDDGMWLKGEREGRKEGGREGRREGGREVGVRTRGRYNPCPC